MRKPALITPLLSSRHAGNRSGQAILEYVLMLLIAVAGVAILSRGLKSSLLSIWGYMAQQISAPCPGCKAPENVKF